MPRMFALLVGVGSFCLAAAASAADTQSGTITLKPEVKNPSSIVTGTDGRLYVSDTGEVGKDGDGRIYVIVDGKPKLFAEGLDDPRGMVGYRDLLFVADKQQIRRLDRKGKASTYAASAGFDKAPTGLTDLAVDEGGSIYASDESGVIYRVERGGRGRTIIDATKTPQLKKPGALVMDGMSFLIVRDQAEGNLVRVAVSDGKGAVIASVGKGRGLAWDYFGRLFCTGGPSDTLCVISRPTAAPIAIPAVKSLPDAVCLGPTGNLMLTLSSSAGEIVSVADQVPGQEVDESPLPLRPAIAFPDLKWEGWQPENDRGQLVALRPILLTHASDGTNRVFVPTEQGVIHVFPNDQKATKTQIFLDIQSKVRYDDRTNEEGFLGMTFHPDFKNNGEFFVFYTLKEPRLTNVISRFHVSKDNPNKADPNSEEEILRISRPFWNHDGGTLCFGPDGYLYVALGDGGLANDPNNNGQNKNSILGKILRIDVNAKEGDKKYGIPKDNPFVGKSDARGEVYAYGLRNVWRMSFDRKTGWLWAADVGQNLYEEIDLIVKGGNYGWRKREGLHPFSTTGVTANDAMIDPIWEYYHEVGKSVTGGNVYRGKLLPELDGHYLCADYVSGKIWALKYDEAKKRVVANHSIPSAPIAVMSFGEDQEGEVYFMTYSTSGKGIYRLERAGPAAATATKSAQ